MTTPSQVDKAGRQIAGLLTYNPGPGIYSRLERAIEAMPENVRVQEIPGLLKRYKDGVPGWELKAVDLDSAIAGRDVVPREELLSAMRERSPVYTHKEIVLGGRPQVSSEMIEAEGGDFLKVAGIDRQAAPSKIGAGVSHGRPAYEPYGQGGKEYTELLLTQPEAGFKMFGSHWNDVNAAPGAANAVAHARFDTHGDALRINELQSDLGIHNRKAREATQEFVAGGGGPDYAPRNELPFPLEDAWADLLVKRLALEAARKGHRAIEVASPRAIADKVGGSIDNYEHFYGKVVPGALERLGRKMGGLAQDSVGQDVVRKGYRLPEAQQAANDAMNDMIAHADGYVGSGWGKDQLSSAGLVEDVVHALQVGMDPTQNAVRLRNHLVTQAIESGYPTQAANTLVDQFMPRLMRQADDVTALQNQHSSLRHLAAMDKLEPPVRAPSRRYLISDEMRRRLIQDGVGAAVAGGVLSQDDLIDRLNQ